MLKQKMLVAVVVLVVAVIGVHFLIGSHAATPYVNNYAVSGTAGGTTSAITGGSSPSGNALQFGTSTSTSSSGCSYDGVVAPCDSGANTGAGASGWGAPVFDDEFNGTSLDTTKWSYGYYSNAPESPTGELTGPVNAGEDDCYNPALVSEGSGYLKLGIEPVSPAVTCLNSHGAAEGYETGMISTLNWSAYSGVTPAAGTGFFTFATGFAEARIWLPTATNAGSNGPTSGATGTISDWPAWWLPGYGEIDILEGLGGSACWHVHNAAYTIGPGGCGSGNFGGGWHTFAVDWTNGSATFYYDGQNVGTETSAEEGDTTPLANTDYKFLILAMQTNQAAYNTTNDPDTAPADMYVDYVRVWQ